MTLHKDIEAEIEFKLSRLIKQFEEELIEGEPREEFFEEDFSFDIVEAESEEGYGFILRRLTRSLWRGEIDIVIFLAIMTIVIRAGFTAAWRSGAAAAGISFDELTPAEIGALEGEITVDVGNLSNLALDIAANTRLLGGALAPLLQRIELWQNRIGEIRAFALRQAAGNQKLMWIWNPLKDHCFAAGTPVLLRDGYRPIEEVLEGDEVWTLQGWCKVTKTTRNLYFGSMYKIGDVVCTAGHRFLTDNGWIKAKNLSDDSIGHLAFPYTKYAEASGSQVSILRSITSALGFLSFGERSKTRMTVPIITVGLNDRCPDPSIHDEFGLDQKEGVEIHAQRFEMRKERQLQLGRFILLNATVAFKKFQHVLRMLFRMFLSPFRQLRLYLREFGGIMRSRIFASGYVNFGLVEAFADSQTKDIGASQNLFLRQTKSGRATLFALRGVERMQDFVSLRCPEWLRHMTSTIESFASSYASTNRTNSTSIARHIDNSLYRVFNLEVEGAHHFVADGMVVHNCEDCLKYNGRVYRASVWEAAGIRPRAGNLACGGWHCGCDFVVTDDPAMPGRPPRPSGG